MSRSYLIEVYKTRHNEILEMNNSWGTKPIAWDYLWGKLNLGKLDGYAVYADQKNMDRLYDMLGADIPRFLKSALFFCGWRCCILREDIDEFKKDIALFASEIATFKKPEYINHWPSLSSFLINYRPPKRLIGIALHGTSVDDEWDSHNLKEPITNSGGLFT